jgi:CarD family transcriptional regulator
MLKIGELVVYPAHGVGVIEAIESKEILGNKQDFYILKILDSNMTIMIPTNNVKMVGLREVIDTDDIPKIYSILRKRNIVVESQPWNRRYRGYMEKIKTGSAFEIAEVVRDLFILKSDKGLSFGERKVLDTARNLLVKELSIAKEIEEEKIETDLNNLFEC